MAEDQGRCQPVQRILQDQPYIDYCSGYSSLADPDVVYHPVGPVKYQNPEFFVRQICNQWLEQRIYILAS